MIENAAYSSLENENVSPSTDLVSYPLAFSWSNLNPIRGEKFNSFRDSILRGANENKIFEITGLYFPDEENISEYENVGLARANAIRELFPGVPDENYRLLGRLVSEKEGVREKTFEAATFSFIEVSNRITEVENKASIQFEYGSARRVKDVQINKYLKDLADRLVKTGESIVLTGHTDNTSSSEFNLRLGQKRADVMKNILIAKGVDPSKITSQSKGESVPISSNRTEEGKAQNRRVELEIKN
jgi:outer membrane protein OmpA-like peptidoglycan-associated protein